jgi:hypothetical protein
LDQAIRENELGLSLESGLGLERFFHRRTEPAALIRRDGGAPVWFAILVSLTRRSATGSSSRREAVPPPYSGLKDDDLKSFKIPQRDRIIALLAQPGLGSGLALFALIKGLISDQTITISFYLSTQSNVFLLDTAE